VTVIGRVPGRARFAAGTLVAVTVGIVLLLSGSHPGVPPLASRHATQRSIDPSVSRRTIVGRSVDGRPIVAATLGDPDARRKLLVVGCIHGDERAGIAIARRLGSRAPPKDALMWVINDLNPDGAAANTRQNARGVDLNRNFPWRWRQLGHPGDWEYPGHRPLSEPEARIARALILRVRPQITIWFHQPLDLVDESGGSARIERRFAQLARLSLARLPRYPGSAVGWQNHRLAQSTAFVVELPPGRPSPGLKARIVGAVGAIASEPSPKSERSPESFN
jgi:murein peptide amidase A